MRNWWLVLALAACWEKPPEASTPGAIPPAPVETVAVGAVLPAPVRGVVPSPLAQEPDAGEAPSSKGPEPWTVPDIAKYRGAIESYVASVKPGNQTALNTAAVPYAHYLYGMHNRIHPLFADSFLASLDALAKTHPLNNQSLTTKVEIVIGPDGRVVRMGLVKASRVTAFDLSAVHSIAKAEPFDMPPASIRSPDGNVYVHWEFYRDEVFACSTMHARPFILSTPP